MTLYIWNNKSNDHKDHIRNWSNNGYMGINKCYVKCLADKRHKWQRYH